MNYAKAETILPDNLIKEIQKYIQGQYVYIPSEPQKKKSGEKIQVIETIYKTEMKKYVVNMTKDIQLML